MTSADVRSLEAIESFALHLGRFRNQLAKELDSLELELRRLDQWIRDGATNYWQDELMNAKRKLSESQNTLSRCMSYVRADEKRPCTEEKKRVEKYKKRVQVCEYQLRFARAALTKWEQDCAKNGARIARCQDLCESDTVVALHHLQDQVETLKQYAQLATGTALTSPISAATGNKKPSNLEAEANDAKD